MGIGNGVGRFAVEGGRIVGDNRGMGRARTRGVRAGGSIHTISCCFGALHGMNVEACAIGGERGVRDWGRDISSPRLTADGDWGTCGDTLIWNRA